MSAGDWQTSQQINQMPIKQGVIINKVLVVYQKFLSANRKYCTNNRHNIDQLALSLNYFLHASEYFFRANAVFFVKRIDKMSAYFLNIRFSLINLWLNLFNIKMLWQMANSVCQTLINNKQFGWKLFKKTTFNTR